MCFIDENFDIRRAVQVRIAMGSDLFFFEMRTAEGTLHNMLVADAMKHTYQEYLPVVVMKAIKAIRFKLDKNEWLDFHFSKFIFET